MSWKPRHVRCRCIAVRRRSWRPRSPGHSTAAAADPVDGGFSSNPRSNFGHHQIVVPDVAGWLRTRLIDLTQERPITTVPDWICEVVSPADRGRDRVRKADLYLRVGVPHYWILDPAERTLEAFEASGARWMRLGAWTDGDTPRVAPFEAVELDVAGFFLPLAE